MQTARIVSLDDAHVPALSPDSVVLPGATIAGAVTLGANASVWYSAVIRADTTPIEVGASSNVQDGAVLHADPGYPGHLGARVTVGHGAIVHGATVEDDCLIGMRAVLMNGVHVGAGSLVAAGALLVEGTIIPPGSLVVGAPAKVRREVGEAERSTIADAWRTYVDLARRHHDATT